MEMARDRRDLSFERERARTMGVLLSAKGQRRELERQYYSEDKGRTRRSKTKVGESTAGGKKQRGKNLPEAVSPKMASADEGENDTGQSRHVSRYWSRAKSEAEKSEGKRRKNGRRDRRLHGKVLPNS